MNREIKFRLWDGNRMTYMSEDYFFNGVVMRGINGLQSISLSTALKNKFDLMQYTGLQDKHGVEIYDGDIINIKTGKDCPVIFKNGGFRYKDDEQLYGVLTMLIAQNCEIIGNIYENPELIQTA